MGRRSRLIGGLTLTVPQRDEPTNEYGPTMIISHTHRYVYIGIPRTGSKSMNR